MATRYVWNKYNRDVSYSDSTSTVSKVSLTLGAIVTFSSSVTRSSSGKYSPSGSKTSHTVDDAERHLKVTGTYPYMFPDGYPTSIAYKAKTAYANSKYGWHQGALTTSMGISNWPDDSDGVDVKMQSNCIDKITAKATYSQGSINYGFVSAASQSSHPTNGYQSLQWYVYKGSDCIDPTAIACTKPKAGRETVITATERPNTYGGTISYLYEYSVDGGNTWTPIETTTSLSTTVTVPDGAEQFQARVRASDDMGFTSTDYVYTDNTEVGSGGIGYCGVEGAIREGVFHACVDGVIKTDFTVCACVDGVIKECS